MNTKMQDGQQGPADRSWPPMTTITNTAAAPDTEVLVGILCHHEYNYSHHRMKQTYRVYRSGMRRDQILRSQCQICTEPLPDLYGAIARSVQTGVDAEDCGAAESVAPQHRPRRGRDSTAPLRTSTASRAAPTYRHDWKETTAFMTPMKRCEWCRRHGTAEHTAYQRLHAAHQCPLVEEEHRLGPWHRCRWSSGGLGVPCRRALAACPRSPPGRGRRSRRLFSQL